MLLSLAPARADPDCSPQDVWNDLSNAWQSLDTCAAACASGVGCFAAFAITGALAAAQAGGDQGAASSFCNDVKTVADDAAAIVGDLQAAGVPQSLVQNVSDALGSVADPLAAAQCACDEESAIGSAIQDIGNCIVQGLCDLSALFGNPCGCTQPPTTVPANCASNISNCAGWTDADPTCQGGGPGNGPIMVQDNWTAPVEQINTPGGTEIIQGDLSCGTSSACFCPKPMIPTWIWNYAQDSNAQNNDTAIFACVCPSGTTPAGATQQNPSGTLTNGISTCICNNTGTPIMAGYGATLDNPCPLPLTGLPCPSGQVRLGQNCVPACAKNEVRTPDGTCCDPNQATFCGQCCPAGMTPNPANGSCSPSPIIQ